MVVLEIQKTQGRPSLIGLKVFLTSLLVLYQSWILLKYSHATKGDHLKKIWSNAGGNATLWALL